MNKNIYIFILVIFILGCSIPDEFGFPTFSRKFNFFVLNDTYSLEELAEEDSTLFFDDILYITKNISEESELGDIQIDDPEERYYTITLNEIVPDSLDLEALMGLTLPIPEFVMVPNNKTLDPYDEFEFITFSEGYIELKLVNNMAIGIGNISAGSPLGLRIYDWDSNLLKEVLFEEDVLPGEEFLTNIDMAGDTFPNRLHTVLFGGSNGSYGEDVEINNDFLESELEVFVNFRNIEASEVIGAKIPIQEIDTVEDESEMDIEYPEIIGDFSFNGFSTIDFILQSPIPGFVDVDLKAINQDSGEEVILALWENGNGHSLSFLINSGETVISISSEEYNINPLLSILPDKFIYQIYATIGDTTTAYDLNSEDIIRTEIEIYAELQFVTGEDGVWFIPQDDGTMQHSVVNCEAFEQKHYDAFEYGVITMKYQNTSGLELGADIFFADSLEYLESEIYNLENPDTTNVRIIHVPLLETTDGNDKITEVVLEKTDLIYFLADSVYTVPRVHVYSAGDTPLGGYLQLSAEVELEILISEDLMEEEEDE